jgi:proline racemase
MFTTIDTHTSGAPTRIITSGIPKLPGANVSEKMEYFRLHHDSIRRLILNEPRGHSDLYGAVITDALQPDADLGAFFMTTSGYLPACVHSSIGVATAFLKTGSLTPHHEVEDIRLETPAGVIPLYPHYEGGRLVSISLQTQPAHIHATATELSVGGTRLHVHVAFSGVFLLLVDVAQLGRKIGFESLPEFVALGQAAVKEADSCLEISHPEVPGSNTVGLVLFYEEVDREHARVIAVSRMGNVDRSPCGAATGALVVLQMSKGNLGVRELYTTESLIGTRFTAQVLRPVVVGECPGAILQIDGSASIIGLHQFVLEADDPLNEGFGMMRRV